jgi:hypothetical protein
MEKLFHTTPERNTAYGKGFLRHADLKSIVACLYDTDKPQVASSVMPRIPDRLHLCRACVRFGARTKKCIPILKTKTIFAPVLNPQL